MISVMPEGVTPISVLKYERLLEEQRAQRREGERIGISEEARRRKEPR